jgi:hypothetical protein
MIGTGTWTGYPGTSRPPREIHNAPIMAAEYKPRFLFLPTVDCAIDPARGEHCLDELGTWPDRWLSPAGASAS